MSPGAATGAPPLGLRQSEAVIYLCKSTPVCHTPKLRYSVGVVYAGIYVLAYAAGRARMRIGNRQE